MLCVTQVKAYNAKDDQNQETNFDRPQGFFEPEDTNSGDESRTDARPDGIDCSHFKTLQSEREESETQAIEKDHSK